MAPSKPAAVSINPATGEEIERFPYLDNAAKDAALDRARLGFKAWSAHAPERRADVLSQVARALRDDHERLARDMTSEIGKPIVQARRG